MFGAMNLMFFYLTLWRACVWVYFKQLGGVGGGWIGLHPLP